MNFSDVKLSDEAKGSLAKLSGGGIPHALVLEGENSSHLLECARFITMYLVCTGENKPCGDCLQCKKASLAEHADIRYLKPENKSKSYSINQMRDIIKDAFVIPNEANAKIYIFEAADKRLSVIVQNAFLKLLEEPPKNVYFLLLCESSKALLPTILSRCSVLKTGGKKAADDECFAAASAVINGIISPREYELLTSVRALSSRELCGEIFALINSKLSAALGVLCGFGQTKDELTRKIISRCTKQQLIRLIELTNDADTKVKQNINMNLLTAWLCSEYRRIIWQR